MPMIQQDEDDKKEDRRASANWHLEKSVSISHLISTAAIILAVLTFASKMDTRVAILEQAENYQNRTDMAQDADRARLASQVNSQLVIINAKLDRIIEHRNGN